MEQPNLFIDLGDLDIGFVDEMVAGGITDDGSPLTGDVSHDDQTDYSKVEITDKELAEEAKRLNLKSLSF